MACSDIPIIASIAQVVSAIQRKTLAVALLWTLLIWLASPGGV